MTITGWLSDNFLEISGAAAGIIYVFLEIRQTIWLWPVGIVTSAFYICIFFTGKLYADMSLQVYYLVISVLGWWWWTRNNKGRMAEGILQVTRLSRMTGIVLAIIFVLLYAVMWLILSGLTDSPVPGWDSLITSLSIVATWMLARKIYEHWLLWIVINTIASLLFLARGLYPTVVLYIVYLVMSFIGLKAWKPINGNDKVIKL